MRKILVSLSIIGVVAVIAIGGTIAYFQDVETSTGNTFSAGTLNLKIKDGGQNWSDGIATAEWQMTDMKPGDSAYGSVDFKNFGTIYADHMEITCDYSVTEENPCVESDTDCTTNEHPDTMANHMTITEMVYSYDSIEVDCLPLITDSNGNGRKDLYDLKTGGVDSLPLSQTGIQFSSLDMSVKFDEDAGNDYQGDTLDLTMLFTLNQDANQ